MSSADPTRRSIRRFKFLEKPSPMGSCDPLLASDAQDTSCKPDFTQCEISTDEVERGDTSKKVWCLKNISNRSNLEALVSSSGCIVELGKEGEDKIQLRFFLKPEVTGVCLPEKDRIKKHMSLWCEVLNGGDGKQLAFAVQVEELFKNLRFEQAIVLERAVIINSETNRQGVLVQSVFLPYLKAQVRGDGQFYNFVYRLESVKELYFGFSVTQLKCTGEGRMVN